MNRLLEQKLRKVIKQIIAENENKKWIKKGDSYWIDDYLCVKFSKVGSYLYANIYLPKAANEYSRDGLLYRYTKPLNGVKKTLDYIKNIDTKYKLKDLKASDIEKKIGLDILRAVSSYEDVIGLGK